jgi:soluble lytic murein transglycosylase
MKLALIALLLAWGLFGLGVFLFAPLFNPSVLSDYQTLWRLRDGLPDTLDELEALTVRQDGVGWQACVLAAHTHEEAGDYVAAERCLRKAMTLYPTRVLRQELAQALEAVGRRVEALREWEQLLPQSEAVQAVQRLESDPIRTAGLLNSAGQYRSALALVGSLSSTPALLARARALVGLGRAKEAVPEFEQILAVTPGDFGIQQEYARALERAGELEKALFVYQKRGAAGAYSAGRLLETLDRPKEAVSAYLLSEEPEARWRAARLLETQGQWDRALVLYHELATESHRVHDDAALRTYVLDGQRGENFEAHSMTGSLPPAFCWLLGTYTPPASADTLPSLLSAKPHTLNVADALLKTLPEEDASQWAWIEVEIALRTANSAERVSIGEWFLAHGDYYNAYKIGGQFLSSQKTKEAYRLTYPRAWWENVQHWASTYHVDPWLVLAVMKEESSFSPTAVSSSDARGLMQLLPSTAKWIVESKLGEAFREEQLFDPDANIRLGTWYLRYVLEQFQFNVVKAVAAYNGGPGNVRRWTEAAGAVTSVDVAAALASPETREYLTKVLNTWLVYRWLYQA